MKLTLRYRAKIIIRAISPFISKQSAVLDIGCGNGVVSKMISDHFKCRLIGTDIMKYTVEEISYKNMPTGTQLDFSEKSFDIGLFNDVLHHIPFDDQIKLIKESLRVCRSVLIFEVKPSIISKIADIVMNRIHNGKMPVTLSFRSREDWMSLFEKNGIACEYFPVKKSDPLYLIENYLFRLKEKQP